MVEVFGVFIVKNREWMLWLSTHSESCARQERDYLINSLGLQARVFRQLTVAEKRKLGCVKV